MTASNDNRTDTAVRAIHDDMRRHLASLGEGLGGIAGRVRGTPRRDPAHGGHCQLLQIKLTTDQADRIHGAARADGFSSTSAWARCALMTLAKKGDLA